MNKREMLQNVYGPEIVDEVSFLEPDYMDEAIIGLAQNEDTMMLIYSEPCILRLLMKNDDLSMDDAVEAFNSSIWDQENILFVDNEVLE